MALQEKFRHVLYYVDLDGGGKYILPDQNSLAAVAGQIEAAEMDLAETRERLAATDKASATAVQGRIDGLTNLITSLGRDKGDIQRFIDEWRPKAKKWVFEMHVASFNERGIARESARSADDLTVIDDEKFQLALLAMCIDKWDFDEAPTEEGIGSLPPAVVENLYAALVSRTTPSPARLSFRRDSTAGSD